MKIPVISIGVFPLIETSKDLAPSGLGMEPANGYLGRVKQSLLRYAVQHILFRKPNKIFHRMLEQYGIAHNNIFLFDLLFKKANFILQSDTPGFEYSRSDLSKNIRFIGALLPYKSSRKTTRWFDERVNKYKRVVLVTQGTVEKDINKIIVPTLEAFKNTDTLVICTTGGSQTAALRTRYSQHNIIIEDFIPFNDVMPYAHAYITNGGYGGVMLGIQNKLPLVVAGVHEGKNEICARVGYFKYGINLKTETPSPAQIKHAVNEVMDNNVYKQNINKLGEEFDRYQPNELCERYVAHLLHPEIISRETAKKTGCRTVLKFSEIDFMIKRDKFMSLFLFQELLSQTNRIIFNSTNVFTFHSSRHCIHDTIKAILLYQNKSTYKKSKAMKKVFLSTLVAAALLISCKKDDVKEKVFKGPVQTFQHGKAWTLVRSR